MAVSTRFALRALLGVQVGLALGLLSQDFLRVLPQISWPGSTAPTFDQPVRPGDQTRRFAPSRPLFRPRQGQPGIDTSDQPSRLFFAPGEGGVIEVTGTIAEGDGARFVDWLAGRRAVPGPLPRVVQFHSAGGSVSDALEIGRAIRAQALDTALVAGSYCLSACPYMLMGGAERRVSEQAKLGVHQHYYGDSYLPAFLAVEDIQRSQAQVLVHLDEMGIDPRLMAVAMSTPPEDIYVLVSEELRDWNVATEVTP